MIYNKEVTIARHEKQQFIKLLVKKGINITFRTGVLQRKLEFIILMTHFLDMNCFYDTKYLRCLQFTVHELLA